MLVLEEITFNDINCFNETEYENLSEEKRKNLIADSIKGQSKNKYFKFYLVKNDNVQVGFVNVCGHSKSVVSIAPEIKERFRRKGYAFTALSKALEIAKTNGYKIAIAGIRKENVASQKLQEKLGFEYVQDIYSKNGNELKFYIKAL